MIYCIGLLLQYHDDCRDKLFTGNVAHQHSVPLYILINKSNILFTASNVNCEKFSIDLNGFLAEFHYWKQPNGEQS